MGHWTFFFVTLDNYSVFGLDVTGHCISLSHSGRIGAPFKHKSLTTSSGAPDPLKHLNSGQIGAPIKHKSLTTSSFLLLTIELGRGGDVKIKYLSSLNQVSPNSPWMTIPSCYLFQPWNRAIPHHLRRRIAKKIKLEMTWAWSRRKEAAKQIPKKTKLDSAPVVTRRMSN